MINTFCLVGIFVVFLSNSSLASNKRSVEISDTNPSSSRLDSLILNDDFDSKRLKKIHRVINESNLEHNSKGHDSDCCKVFPLSVTKVVTDYIEYSPSIKNVYGNVMNKLGISEQEMGQLDFYDESFAKQLYQIMLSKKNSLSTNYYFKYNLEKLLFKWMIYMKEKFANNDKEFERISNDLQLFKFLEYDVSFDFQFESKYELSNKIQVEIIENHSFIFPQFSHAIKSFYYLKKENVDCDKLKDEFFNGNYNSNIPLKYMIAMFDPQGEMRECILKDDPDLKELEASSSKINDILRYLKNIKSKIPMNPETIDESYMDIFTLESLVQINGGFEMNDYQSGFQMLLKIEYLSKRESFNKESIMKIFGFKSSDPKNQTLEWNQRKFEDMLLIMDSSISKKCYFAYGLYHKLLSKKDKIPKNDPFWYDLQRLLFKWLIRRKQARDEEEFKDSLEIVQHFIPILKEKSINLDFSFEFDPINMSRNEMITFKELIDCELLEDAEKLATFASILENHYKIKEEEKEKSKYSICNELKWKYFDNDFNNDQLLKFAIILYDPKGNLRQECFPEETNMVIKLLDIKKEKNEKWTLSSLFNYTDKLRNLNKFSDLIVSDMNNISEHSIRIFSKYNLKFLIKNSNDLIILLNKLRRERKLDERLLSNIIKFKCEDEKNEKDAEEFTWGGEFRRLLKVAKNKKLADQKDFEFFMELVTDPEFLISKKSK